jgi:Bacteriophage probable baseplate hub protein
MALADPLRANSPTVEIGGQSYPLVQQNLVQMRMRERIGGLSSLELSLVDTVEDGGTSHYAAGAGSPLELGAGVRVFAGPHQVGAPEIFDGQITALEAEICESQPPLITILAEDRLFPARRRRRTRLFEQQTLEQVISTIVGDYGLTPEARDGIDTTARNWMQADETDLAFMRAILHRFDCDMQIVGNRLQLGRVGMNRRSLVPLSVGNTLISARIIADVAEQVSTLTLGSFDPRAGDAVDASEGAAAFGPGSGSTGPDILREKFAEVTMHLGREPPLTDADATKLAELEGQRRARSFVRIEGCARGNGNLRVGSWVELAGVNPRFANQYAVKEAVHHFDLENGYRTDFVAESAYLGAAQ